MKLAIAVGVFLLAGIPCGAHAQTYQSETQPRIAAPTPKPVQRPRPPDDYRATVEMLESGEKVSGVLLAGTKCATMVARYNDLTRYVGRLNEVEEILGGFGKALSATSLLIKVSTGNTSGAVADIQDSIQDVVITQSGCLVFGPLCPVYKAGMTVGTIINYLPKLLYGDVNEQTIKEVVSDYYAPMWGDLVNGKTVAQVEAGIEKMRADARKARASAQYAHNASQMCKTEATKSAVADILAKAKANAAATPMTPLGSGLSAQTDAAIDAGRASADGAIAAGNGQIMDTIQTMQQQALQKQLDAQALQSSSSTSSMATSAQGYSMPSVGAGGASTKSDATGCLSYSFTPNPQNYQNGQKIVNYAPDHRYQNTCGFEIQGTFCPEWCSRGPSKMDPGRVYVFNTKQSASAFRFNE